MRRVLPFGTGNQIRAQQRRMMNRVNFRQVGIDRTARVRRDDIGNRARVTQRSPGV